MIRARVGRGGAKVASNQGDVLHGSASGGVLCWKDLGVRAAALGPTFQRDPVLPAPETQVLQLPAPDAAIGVNGTTVMAGETIASDSDGSTCYVTPCNVTWLVRGSAAWARACIT